MNATGSAAITASTIRIRPEQDNILPEPGDTFVATAQVQEITEHAVTYLQAGFPVHLAGPAGTGKTTLAFHVASQLGRRVLLVHGDDEFGSSDLIGRDGGYSRSRVVDNYIHSVLKTREEARTLWIDNRLTMACEKGYTFIYDEFNRSRPEANNPLLSILSERLVNLPQLGSSGQGYLEVHPQFRAIFTSNPEEYAGTHGTQDAFMDRVITIRLGHYDRETEIKVTRAKSGVSQRDAEVIVDTVRELRNAGASNHRPTIRACIVIATVLASREAHARPDDSVFQWVCRDVLCRDTAKVMRGGQQIEDEKVAEVLARVCAAHN